MANTVTATVDFRQLVKRLEALPVELGSKRGGPLRVALRAGGRVIQADAKSRAENLSEAVSAGGSVSQRSTPSQSTPADTAPKVGRSGRLARAIRLSLVKRPAMTEEMQIWVYPGRKRGDPRGAYYWRFVEFGTSLMQARPFLRPAFEAKKREALGVFSTTFGKAIAAAERKLSRMR